MYVVIVLETLVILLTYYFNFVDVLFVISILILIQYLIVYDYLKEKEEIVSILIKECKLSEKIHCNSKGLIILYFLYLLVASYIIIRIYNVFNYGRSFYKNEIRC